METKNVTYLNAALAVIVAVSVVMMVKTYQRTLEEPAAPAAVSVSPETEASPAVTVKAEPPPANIHQIQDIYRYYPAEDTGTNMPQAWARVKPEEKAKANEELDRKISEAKAALEADPADKKAKHMLFIAETVKKLAANDFNYTQDPVAEKTE